MNLEDSDKRQLLRFKQLKERRYACDIPVEPNQSQHPALRKTRSRQEVRKGLSTDVLDPPTARSSSLLTARISFLSLSTSLTFQSHIHR